MRTRLTASLATLALSGAFLAGVAAPSNAATPTVAPAAAPTQAAGATAAPAPVSTTFTNGNVLTGQFTPTSFVNQGGTLTAIGTFTGTLKDASGAVLQTFTNTATSAAVTNAAPNGSCTILDLTLGPLNLNLLGLVVQTNQIHLTITAQQGPGNLLGNLLCSVANLLNGGTGLTGLANLLNQLLGL